MCKDWEPVGTSWDPLNQLYEFKLCVSQPLHEGGGNLVSLMNHCDTVLPIPLLALGMKKQNKNKSTVTHPQIIFSFDTHFLSLWFKIK